MKSSKRLDISRLSEALFDRGLIEDDKLQAALEDSKKGDQPFPELLVQRDLITDWELSRQVCRLYGLPFVPVTLCTPEADAIEELEEDFIRKHRLVPMRVHDSVLTVCMAGLCSSEVLEEVEKITGKQILPMVGTVRSNEEWLREAYASEGSPGPAGPGDDWSKMFDQADEAVLMDLDTDEPAEVQLPEFPPLPEAG